MRDCCRNDWTGQNVRFLIVASYHLVHICARLANSTAAWRREGQGALMRRRMSLTILGVSPAWHKVLPAEERVERKQTERVAHIACMQNPGWISPGHSVSGTHGLADRLNARSHQMTLGRLNRVLRPPAHEMHIAHLIWLTSIVLWKDNGTMTLSFGVVHHTCYLSPACHH